MKNRMLKGLVIVSSLVCLTGCDNSKETDNSSATSDSAVAAVSTGSSVVDEQAEVLPEIIERNDYGKSIGDYLRMPATAEKKELKDLKQLIYSVGGFGFFSRELTEDFVADVKAKKMYLYPWDIESTEPDWTLTTKDVTKLRELVEACGVQDWQGEYLDKEGNPVGKADGSTWTVILVFEGDLVEVHKGEYPDGPEKLGEFKQGLLGFREEQRSKWRRSINEKRSN